MKTKLKHVHEKLFASYWFVPALMCLFTGGVACAALGYDARTGAGTGREWLEVNTVEGARELLSTIAGAAITVAGVVFSITILALSFASSHFGPRVLRNFMRDRESQFVLGVFVSTYLYCILVLRTIGGKGAGHVPHISVAGAVVLGVATVAVLIFFVHHVARVIQASSIIGAVGRDLDALIREFTGERRGGGSADTDEPRGRNRQLIASESDGYVQALSSEALVEVAAASNGVIELHVEPGDYVSVGWRLATLHSDEVSVAAKASDTIRDGVDVGTQRTNEQDLAFPIDQLAEIAVRALSPGLNDPFTALQCINRLGGALTKLASLDWPAPVVRDEKGVPRLHLLPTTMERLLHRAFGQILHFGGSNPVVVRHVMKMLMYVSATATPRHAPAVGSYADATFKKAVAAGLVAENPEIGRFHQAIGAGHDGKD